MEYVDLRKRREERAKGHRGSETSRPGIARDPLLLVGTGFVLGTFASLVFSSFIMFFTGWMDPIWPLFLFGISLLPLLGLSARRFFRRDTKPAAPSLGSEKQLLLAILDAGGSMTPVEAALETSLTVDEAEELLTRFADRGHLVVQSRDGVLFYTLPNRRASEPQTF